jgi:DNA-binding IclR family transcriptional regulator
MAADRIEEKLDDVIELLKQLIAIELARGGVPQAQIAKRVKLATATVNKMLQGLKNKRSND